MNINNSKYIFYAFNKKWKSIRECCKYYEVRYGSVMSYKRIHKCTAEEAIAYCRNLKKLGIFEYYGAAEPPVRCGESHLSGLTEPPQFVY